MPAKSRVVSHVRAALTIAVAIVLAVAAGPESSERGRAMQESGDDGGSGIRIVHGIADAGPLDVYIDGSIALIGIVFAETSGLLTLPAGDHAFAVVPTAAAPEAAIADGTIALQDETRYYATLLGTVAAASVGLFAVDDRTLDAGRARFRIISGVADAGAVVPVFAGGDALSEPLEFGDASEYAAIDAGIYDLDVLDAVSGGLVLTLPQTSLAEGTATDVILVGQVVDATLQALVLPTTVDVARLLGLSGQIVVGSCAEPGDLAADLGIVQVGQGEAVGAAETALVAQGFGLAAVPFAALIGSPHAISVSEDGGGGGDPIACGDIGGSLTDTGALVIALESDDSSAANGVAVLAPALEDPETTGVSVFLTTGVSAAGAAATPEPVNG